MSEDHKIQFQENIAAYALGALDQEEAVQLEEHLQSCQECQHELADYQSIAVGLLESVPPIAPDPKVKNALAARLPNDGTEPSSPTLWSKLQSLFQFSFGKAAAVVAVIFLVGLNIISLIQIRDLRAQQVELAQRIQAEQSAIALLAYPGTQIISASETRSGSLLINTRSNTAILLTHDLPELPADKTYQIWLIDEQGNRVSGGLFLPQTEQAYNLVEVDRSYPLEDFVALGVTIEPWGGSPGPTGTNVLKVTF